MMVGLNGAGKTTTTAKLAGKMLKKGKRPLLVACDVYRPAAIEQLQINGQKQGVPVFAMGDKLSPVDIAKASIEHAKKNNNNVVILDTAGRLHVDEELMQELKDIQSTVHVDETLLTVDALVGQNATNVALTFNSKIKITGLIMTKLDGDSRGGAALSIKKLTGIPIKYAGVG
jgi:signal recognition particle subunit SRP54